MRILPDVDMQEIKSHQDLQDEDDKAGKFVNLEISFAYRATTKATASVGERLKNARLLIDLTIGAAQLFSQAFPVFVELRGVVGTVRARLRELLVSCSFNSLMSVL